MTKLDRKALLRLFKLLNDELKTDSVSGELYLVGGAVMCLVLNARESTRDVDSLFQPSTKIRTAARRVAAKLGYSEDWLNDGVKAFLSPRGEFSPFLDLSHLKVYTAHPEYLLAMKCLSMRLGEEFHDLDDVRFLLRSLNITKHEDACAVIAKFYPLNKFPQKTLYVLEELLPKFEG